MEIVIRRTEVKDIDGLCELYSQPQAQAQTLQLPIPSLHSGKNASQQYLIMFTAMLPLLMGKLWEILALST